MAEFLRQVADHYLALPDISGRCFIFPNRRSLSFFRKFLADAVRERKSGAIIAPRMYTVNDFFYHVAGASVTDRVNLLIRLYDIYRKLYRNAEPLDDFIFWGDLLLADFNDVDKYLADPKGLFANVSDFRSIQDTYSYLSDTQRKAIEDFLGHFHDRNKLTVDIDSDNPNVKEKFLRIWDILHDLYTGFNESLAKDGMAYEGMVYRRLAERVSKDGESVVDIMSAVFPSANSFVFVGLNALNECEKRLMGRMRDAGIAEFCWDWSGEWVKDSRNKSSVFMKENVEAFPQAFTPAADGVGCASFTVLSVPSAIGQAKQLPSILKSFADSLHGGNLSCIGADTALVLPDEDMLIPVLNSIPEEIVDLNVTMGYPMASSEFYSLMNDISNLQLNMRKKDGRWYFYHKQLWSIFSNSVFKASIGEDARRRLMDIKARTEYFVAADDIVTGIDDAVLSSVFRVVVTDPRTPSADAVHEFESYQLDVISAVASRLKGYAGDEESGSQSDECGGMSVELEFARQYYMSVMRLRRIEMDVLPSTYVRLLSRLVGTASVPFQGEPLKGLQIMGPLETRALDFRNLVILSCNEGVFPRRAVGSSFIPPELRKGFGLPTYEYQDAVWAYYFYRMIQRAENVWMLVDSRVEGVKGGEESRYIKQLELHFGADVRRMVAKAPIGAKPDDSSIPKTQADVDVIMEKNLSASSMKNYLDCPAKFYYHMVKGLKQEDDITESMDAGMIGNVFHGTMQAIYLGEFAMNPEFSMEKADVAERRNDWLPVIHKEYIESWMKRPEEIKARIRSLVMKELHSIEVTGRNIVLTDVVFQYVMKVLERDLEHMLRLNVTSFTPVGLEKKCEYELDGFRFVGYIDRLDNFEPGRVRVVDYKTGKVEEDDIMISDDNAESIVSKVFGPSNASRPKIALQLFLYDMFIRNSLKEGETIVNSIYSPARLFVNEVEDVPESRTFSNLMVDGLKGKLKEIVDLNVPFRRTSEAKTCEFCEYKMICGR